MQYNPTSGRETGLDFMLDIPFEDGDVRLYWTDHLNIKVLDEAYGLKRANKKDIENIVAIYNLCQLTEFDGKLVIYISKNLQNPNWGIKKPKQSKQAKNWLKKIISLSKRQAKQNTLGNRGVPWIVDENGYVYLGNC